MLVRYSIHRTPQGQEIRRKAAVYSLEEHGIDRSRIDPEAVRLIQRLRRARFQGYVVGGAIRDLLVGIVPKDFDIATDAHPAAVRKLFRSSRVIGRRFKLVHVYSAREKYLEVATFRSSGDDGSQYGTMAEDAVRRDFTLNALFYDPLKQQVVDYVGGVKDIRSRRIRTIAPEVESFREDPVRMIRAVKHAAIVGFRLPLRMRRAIRRVRHDLAGCSPQRLTEELYKILRSGRSRAVMESAYRVGLLEVILPALHRALGESRGRERSLWERLATSDALPDQERATIATGRLVAALMADCIEAEGVPPKVLVEVLREACAPLTPSNNDLRAAAGALLQRPVSARL